MSESVTRSPATAEEQSSIPLLETDIVFADLLICISFAILSLVAAIVLILRMSSDAWGGQLTLALFFLAVAIWIVFTPQTYHLYPDKLIIKKPLTYLPFTTTVIPVSAIKEVIIKEGSYPRRRTYLTIRTHSRNYEYRIAKDIDFIDGFIGELQQLGVHSRKSNFI